MSSNFIFTALLLCVSIIPVLSCNEKKGAIISYNTKIITLGNIEFKKAFQGKFLIRNIGDAALQIYEVTPDCSCTVPTISKSSIQPGDSTYINFILTPGEDGLIQQSLYVDNNSINESRILFLVRANVKLQ